MKDDSTQILGGNTPEDSDTKILKSEDTVVDDSTVVIDEQTVVDEPTVIDADNDSGSTPLENPHPSHPASPEPAGKKSKAWIAWVVGLVVLGGAGAGAWCLFGDSSNDVNTQADHSDDDEFENFGRMIRAVEDNPSFDEPEYEDVYATTESEYYPVEVAEPYREEAPAADPYEYYAPVEAAPAAEAAAW